MTATPAFRVVVAGGGVAGLEGLLALHGLAADRLDLTLLAPEPDFVYRPMAVARPFALGGPRRHPLKTVAADTGATLVEDAVAGVDDAGGGLTTARGYVIAFDALLLATGARPVHAIEHATLWDDRADDELLGGLLRDLEEGWTKRLAFVIPPGPGWPLPAYELALLTARQVAGMGADAQIWLISPEPAPLAAFGDAASREVAAELDSAGVRFEGGVAAAVERGAGTSVLLRPSDRRLEVDRVVALPRVMGRAPQGVPVEDDGFVPVDEHCKVVGLKRTWAAGDGVDFPIKFGGLAAEQADSAAAAIAARAGADVTPEPFRPVLRGRLLTGAGSRYVHFDPAAAGPGTVADHALWWPPTKVAGRRLAPYLAERDEAFLAPGPPHEAGLAVQADLVARELAPPPA